MIRNPNQHFCGGGSRFWTRDKVLALHQRYLCTTDSAKDFARANGFSMQNLFYLFNRENLTQRKQHRFTQVAEAKVLYSCGMGIIQLAGKFGVHYSTIFRRFLADGFAMRPRSGGGGRPPLPIGTRRLRKRPKYSAWSIKTSSGWKHDGMA